MTNPTTLSLAADAPCLTCGYNLRSLPPDSLCPECGTSVQHSLSKYGLISIPARWFSAVRVGIVLLIASFFLQFLWTFALILSRSPYIGMDWYFFTLSIFRSIFPWALFISRWWAVQLMAEDPPLSSHSLPPRPRRRARLAAHAVFALSISTFLLQYSIFAYMIASNARAEFVAQQVGNVMSIWMSWTLFSLVASLAAAMAKSNLARHASQLRWVWAACFFLIFFETALYWVIVLLGMPDRTANQIVTYSLGFPNAVLLLAAVVWSLITLIRLYQWLRFFQPFAPATPPGTAPAWLPQILFAFVHRIKSIATYHGPPRE